MASGTPACSGRSNAMQCPALPRTLMGYVVRCSGRHQIGLAVLAACVFGLSSVPLEFQRRIVNDAIKNVLLETCLADNRQAWDLCADGRYVQRTPGDDPDRGTHRLLLRDPYGTEFVERPLPREAQARRTVEAKR